MFLSLKTFPKEVIVASGKKEPAHIKKIDSDEFLSEEEGFAKDLEYLKKHKTRGLSIGDYSVLFTAIGNYFLPEEPYRIMKYSPRNSKLSKDIEYSGDEVKIVNRVKDLLTKKDSKVMLSEFNMLCLEYMKIIEK